MDSESGKNDARENRGCRECISEGFLTRCLSGEVSGQDPTVEEDSAWLTVLEAAVQDREHVCLLHGFITRDAE